MQPSPTCAASKKLALSLAVALSVSSVGCGDDVTGDWVSAGRVEGEANKLIVNEDGAGQAELWVYTTPSTAGEYVFAVAWSGEDTPYTFALNCEKSPYNDGVCTGNDSLEMTCNSDEDFTRLDCSAGGNWSEYVFEWVRLPQAE